MNSEQALPKLAMVINCARCGCKLRSTNVNHYCNQIGRPVCDPCAGTIGDDLDADAAKLGGWGRGGNRTLKETHAADLYCLKLAGTVQNLTSSHLGTLTGTKHAAAKQRLRRLVGYGWLRMERVKHMKVFYRLTDAGIAQIEEGENDE